MGAGDSLQTLVAAVAKGRGTGALAVAKGDTLARFEREFAWFEFRAGVGAVAKRLVGGTTAGAPVVGAGVEFEDCGLVGGDEWE